MTLSKDNNDAYIAYHYGTPETIELQYPETLDKLSWDKFIYSFYLRSGGEDNSGMDLNYVSFVNNNYQYIIYHTYLAETNESKVGLIVLDARSETKTYIKGKYYTRLGTLTYLRYNQLLEIGDELYD